MALGRLSEYPSVWATAKALAPMLEVGSETLRKWIVQTQVDSWRRTGATSAKLEQFKALKRENRDLREANEILRARGCRTIRRLRPSFSRQLGGGKMVHGIQLRESR
jgi:transposase